MTLTCKRLDPDGRLEPYNSGRNVFLYSMCSEGIQWLSGINRLLQAVPSPLVPGGVASQGGAV